MPRYWYHMHSWIRGVALLIYGGQHHIEHYLPLEQGHPTTSDPSTILLREYQLVLKVPIGTAPSKIQTLFHNYSYVCCFSVGLRAVLSFRGRLKYVLIAKFYAESNGYIHWFSETSYRAAI
jgi:hypothetical protein